MGDGVESDNGDGVFVRGDDPSIKILQMILNRFLACSLALISSRLFVLPAQAGTNCRPRTAVSSYRLYMNGGATSRQAINLSIQENYDGTESCKWRINSAFKESGLRMPFANSETRTLSNTVNKTLNSNCSEKVDEIFYNRYPELRGKKLNNMNGPLVREWMDIQDSIC